MTFSQRVKTEICEKNRRTDNETLALLFGMLSVSRDYGKNNIVIYSEFEPAIRTAVKILTDFFGADDISVESVGSENKSRLFCTLVYESSVIRKLYSRFGKTIGQNEKPGKFLYGRNTCSSFLAGVYLACGTISDPERSYHLELSVQDEKKAEDILSLLEFCEISFKSQVRRGSNVIYTKDSTSIEDFLTLVGACGCSLELMNIKVMKDIRNKINRENNCFSGNIGRAADAAVRQLEAIEILKKTDSGLEMLPCELREIAQLRIDNPEETLSELCELTGGKYTKSSMNRKLARLISLSKNVKL